jgi:hypothetical protein
MTRTRNDGFSLARCSAVLAAPTPPPSTQTHDYTPAAQWPTDNRHIGLLLMTFLRLQAVNTYSASVSMITSHTSIAWRHHSNELTYGSKQWYKPETTKGRCGKLRGFERRSAPRKQSTCLRRPIKPPTLAMQCADHDNSRSHSQPKARYMANHSKQVQNACHQRAPFEGGEAPEGQAHGRLEDS